MLHCIVSKSIGSLFAKINEVDFYTMYQRFMAFHGIKILETIPYSYSYPKSTYKISTFKNRVQA